ncbi:uncharacterized protein LOC126829758 isoform X2 [Patella vulgata]|uniref:uncharacterized protein LOC126829758 isoform X2 n=1 Tax=Patella vulgata TaxID=6465 RepID=UPI0024A80BB1|nr:uncharacterized protein LOC126829758 isoform X2 [Patella vulgata]
MPIPSDINTYHSPRRSAPRNWIQTSVKNMQLPSQPVDYTTNIDVSNPYCSVPMNGPTIMSNSPSLPVPNPTTYFMPVINVPYPPNIGHVNFNIGPSQDPYGKDLPQDVNTLRYFYNFGVESCRMMSTVMPPPTTISYAPAVVPAENQCHMIMSAPMEHGQSRTSDKTNACCTQNQNNHHKNVTVSVKDNSVNSDRDVHNESKDIETDAISNSDNSGLASPDKLDSLGSDSGLDSTTSGAEEPLTYTIDSQDTGKVVKGKRKYYMYGNLKLVKPIKEIPPRFQMLLAETSAAKARCEGQPIYIQTHSENIAYDQETELNANARCFVPMQNCMPPSMNCTNVNNNLTGVGSNHAIQPNITPIPNACFPPPPPYVMGGAQSAMVHGPPPPAPPQVTNYSKVQVSSQTLTEPPVSNNVGASSNYLNSNSGGGTCYYVYSSTSSGYSTLPPTTPTPPGNGQGQVIYVMNSPYTAPPVQTYQPMQPVPPYVTCSATAQ